jgi:glutamate racemase
LPEIVVEHNVRARQESCMSAPPQAAPIAVFDSGVGGLTVLRALKQALPHESTLYLGDTARVPYGTRSHHTVIKYALNNVRTLVSMGEVKLVVVACNTVSAVALPALRAELAVPVVGVIDAGAQAACQASRGGAVAVIGTPGTVRSGAYERALREQGFVGDVISRACPLFVPLAEEGWTSGDVPRLVAQRYLADLPRDVDTLVLGCTHYPLLRAAVAAALAHSHPHIAIVDGAHATALHVATLTHHAHHTHDDHHNQPSHRLLVTDAPEQMARLAPAFLGETIDARDVELIDVMMTA